MIHPGRLPPLARHRLKGFTLDGLEDPCRHGRGGQRDTAFADGLSGTGLRPSEWAGVLAIALPGDDRRSRLRCRTLSEILVARLPGRSSG